MPESHRDAGLIRAVGAGTLAASIVNTVVGAGIFRVPAALAANVGVYALVERGGYVRRNDEVRVV